MKKRIEPLSPNVCRDQKLNEVIEHINELTQRVLDNESAFFRHLPCTDLDAEDAQTVNILDHEDRLSKLAKAIPDPFTTMDCGICKLDKYRLFYIYKPNCPTHGTRENA